MSDDQKDLEHYKKRCKELEAALGETQSALDEFQQSSKELEHELERELGILEKHNKNVLKKNELMKTELESWKSKYQNSTKDSNATMAKLQREIQRLNHHNEKYKVRLRDMELDNDDLEKSERAKLSSLMDLEFKYNREVEKNVLLEQELQIKNELEIQVQRLKDELRDANLELSVRKSSPESRRNPPSPPTSESGGLTRRPTPISRIVHGRDSPIVRSSSRMSTAASESGEGSDVQQNPVKAIQDMVGRVKSLEARLASCRSLVTPLLANTSHAASLRNGSRPASPRTSTPSILVQRITQSRQSMRSPIEPSSLKTKSV